MSDMKAPTAALLRGEIERWREQAHLAKVSKERMQEILGAMAKGEPVFTAAEVEKLMRDDRTVMIVSMRDTLLGPLNSLENQVKTWDTWDAEGTGFNR